jgi:hypothetical protein
MGCELFVDATLVVIGCGFAGNVLPAVSGAALGEE